MAHFAEIDDNNKVLRVIVVDNHVLIAPGGEESELLGIEFCKSLFGQHTKWIQTSYNSNFRKRYAGIGMTYDSNLDVFIPAKIFESWVLDEEFCDWKAPIPKPDDGNDYFWDESTVSWKQFTPTA